MHRKFDYWKLHRLYTLQMVLKICSWSFLKRVPKRSGADKGALFQIWRCPCLRKNFFINFTEQKVKLKAMYFIFRSIRIDFPLMNHIAYIYDTSSIFQLKKVHVNKQGQCRPLFSGHNMVTCVPIFNQFRSTL